MSNLTVPVKLSPSISDDYMNSFVPDQDDIRIAICTCNYFITETLEFSNFSICFRNVIKYLLKKLR